jgi:hypothetical protein
MRTLFRPPFWHLVHSLESVCEKPLSAPSSHQSKGEPLADRERGWGSLAKKEDDSNSWKMTLGDYKELTFTPNICPKSRDLDAQLRRGPESQVGMMGTIGFAGM